jgi:hypothetical protein
LRLDSHAVAMSLVRVDLDIFTLRSRGFHRAQQHPYFT